MKIPCHAMLYFCHASWLDSVPQTQHGMQSLYFPFPFYCRMPFSRSSWKHNRLAAVSGSPWTQTPDQHYFLPREALWAARLHLQGGIRKLFNGPCVELDLVYRRSLVFFGLDSWDSHFLLGALTDWKFLRLLSSQADVFVSHVGGCHCNLGVHLNI